MEAFGRALEECWMEVHALVPNMGQTFGVAMPLVPSSFGSFGSWYGQEHPVRSALAPSSDAFVDGEQDLDVIDFTDFGALMIHE